jgi:hypothetical protein
MISNRALGVFVVSLFFSGFVLWLIFAFIAGGLGVLFA